MRRARPVLLCASLAAAAVVVLTGCAGEPEPVATPLNRIEACAALQDAVVEFYEIAQPGSTVDELPNHDLPTIKDFVIPKPTCAFQVRPDPAVIPGDVFMIEAFYLDYDEEMTVTLPEKLIAAGFRRTNPSFDTYAATKLGHAYSAAMLLFAPGDGQGYSEAAEHFRLLDLSIGQN